MSNPQASGAELIRSIDQKIEKIRSRPLDLSFNELLDMHKNKELIIDPEYQRLFRWSEGKQSRFIETLLLEMPIPPIYVIEIEDSIYELIDGLQRISSYLHFRGEHPDRLNDDGTYHKLTLRECISSISEERADQKGDQELVLRFFAFKNNRQNYMHDVGDFMTEYMEAVSDPAKMNITFDYPTERLIFEKTFKILNRTLGASA